MSRSKKLVQAFCNSLFFSIGLLLIGGCASVTQNEAKSLAVSAVPDCSKAGRPETFTVLVYYEFDESKKIYCPARVGFDPGGSGCEKEADASDKYPAACLCEGKNEGLAWKADRFDESYPEFAIHFSPFQHGSAESNRGEIRERKIVPLKKKPKQGKLVTFEYSITAGEVCDVIDPPVIIKQ